MARYVAFRILGMIGTLIVVSFIVFAMMHAAPGGPWDTGRYPLTGAARDNMLRLYGMDKPLLEQYIIYMGNLLRFDFGVPFTAPELTVQQIFARTWPISLQLAGLSVAIAFPLGFALGITSALRQNTRLDYVLNIISVSGLLIPPFVLAYIFIMIFGVQLDWLPIFGWNDSREWLIPGVINKTWVMPVVIWALGIMAPIARYTRSAVIDVKQSDYVRTARAKGLHEQPVLWRHIMRNALIPIIAVVVPMIPGIITGNSWLEMAFAIPGIGRYFVESALKRDYVMIMAVMLLWAFLLSLFNLLADILYALVDPRVRFGARK